MSNQTGNSKLEVPSSAAAAAAAAPSMIGNQQHAASSFEDKEALRKAAAAKRQRERRAEKREREYAEARAKRALARKQADDLLAEEGRDRAREYRAKLARRERDRSMFEYFAVLPLYERLVIGGAPPTLATRIRHWVEATLEPLAVGAQARFSSLDTYDADDATGEHRWVRIDNRVETGIPQVAHGCDMRTLLEAEGFRDVVWRSEDVPTQSIYPRTTPPQTEKQWRCEFTATRRANDGSVVIQQQQQ